LRALRDSFGAVDAAGNPPTAGDDVPPTEMRAGDRRAAGTSWTELFEPYVTIGLCALLLAIAALAVATVRDLVRDADLEALTDLRIATLIHTTTLLEGERADRYAKRLDARPVRARDSSAIREAIREAIRHELAEMQRLDWDESLGQSARSRALRMLVQRQLQQIEQSDAAPARLDIEAEASLMAAIRTLAGAMEQAEQDLLRARSMQSARERGRLVVTLLSLTALAIAATLGAAWQLHRDLRRLRHDERSLRHEVAHDALTGLANRRYFAWRLRSALRSWLRGGASFSLVLVDIDRFKQINDSLGHRAGDLVLKVLAARLRDGFRAVDLVARIGGEEFGVILPGLDAASAYQVADRVRSAIAAQPFSSGRGAEGKLVAVTVSMGVADARVGPRAHALMDAADRALYAAKQTGRNRVVAAESS
jgi:diguanylate cyclase (GGDEF)-like protein